MNLTPGAVSTLAGKSLTINATTAIENAFTGDGNDSLIGNNADNLLYGGRGNDTINGGAGKDIIIGAQGNDTLSGGTDIDRFVIQQDAGSSDRITDFTLQEQIQLVGFSQFKSFADLSFLQNGADTLLNLGNGQTLTLSNVSFNSLSAGNFSFTQTFNFANTDFSRYNPWFGTTGNDYYFWTASIGQTFFAQDGNDTIFGGVGNDTINGGAGNDVLVGENGNQDPIGGNDIINGDSGDDQLYGGSGNDTLSGGSGNDIVRGDAGNDVIYLEGDKDNIYGGAGSDLFVVVPNSKSYGFSIGANGLVANNVIWDFTPSDPNEKIDFSAINNVTSFQDLRLQNTNINGNQFTWIYFPGNTPNQYVAVYGVNKSVLTSDNFIFHQNIAPTTTVDTVETDEDTTLNISASTLLANDSDADGHTLQLTGVDKAVNGTVSLDTNSNVVFNPNANFNGEASFNYTISDGHGGTATQKVTVQVKPINDSPTITLTTGNLSYTDNAGSVVIDSGIVLSDLDNSNLQEATVKIINYMAGEDSLVFTNQNGITGSFNSATGILSLIGVSSIANYETALRTIKYINSSNNPNTTPRSISFQVNDGNLNSTAVTRNVTITPVNNAPVVTNAIADQTAPLDSVVKRPKRVFSTGGIGKR